VWGIVSFSLNLSIGKLARMHIDNLGKGRLDKRDAVRAASLHGFNIIGVDGRRRKLLIGDLGEAGPRIRRCKRSSAKEK